jgi:rubredoxin
MITPIEMYCADCNICKKQFETGEGYMSLTEKSHLYESLTDSDWYVDGDNAYCPDCHYINDDDHLVLKIN